jgi:hypothetical protein
MPASRSLHERLVPLGWVRRPLRRAFFRLFRKAADTEEGRAGAASALAGLLDNGRELWHGLAGVEAPPYAELGRAAGGDPGRRDDVIFITGRFRSGSTLLWNLFRHLDGCTSYYEPLNERRWFDPSARGARVDATHRKVEEYWREYDGLGELGHYYQATWNDRHLLMGPDFWEPNLRRYVGLMIERAPGRPVLQFNRIDFRLPWFRRHFPAARLVHLCRHPRDQWCSSLVDPKRFPADADPAGFARHDGFYLLSWARDLRYQFPFLDEREAHPYQLFYYLWKLSYLFGRRYAHHSVCFEQLVEDPGGGLRSLFAAVGVEGYDLERLKGLIVKPALGKWREYAGDDWFRRHEETCEEVLADFLGRAPGQA